jgi:hypothetical protein
MPTPKTARWFLAVLWFANSGPGIAAQPTAATAESVLRGMNLEQKAGQVFVPWILATERNAGAARERMRALIQDAQVGGYVLSLGSAGEAARLIDEKRSAQ